jgi:hypothetical protein
MPPKGRVPFLQWGQMPVLQNIYIVSLDCFTMRLEKNSPLYWLALLLPLIGLLVLVVQFYSIGHLGYSILTAAIFLMFSAMGYYMNFRK